MSDSHSIDDDVPEADRLEQERAAVEPPGAGPEYSAGIGSATEANEADLLEQSLGFDSDDDEYRES